MQLEFEAPGPQPELDVGDIWHDSAEHADWLESLCPEDGEGAAAPDAAAPDAAASAAAAAAAFADASSIFHSMCPDGHLTAQARMALEEQMGVSSWSGWQLCSNDAPWCRMMQVYCQLLTDNTAVYGVVRG